ncbi:FxSxx-COOH system tetratricopeptide repeat protein [Streptomyces triculaminicus]|uniref:FxSxx-COOH system tetratricopeptide repeat protein n=1 Tax=Streptomyces triculaminicus TaxID=2816232 RepID=UPI001F5E6EA9|nr:FxSxx-COOH system tetratricopeptide repeat protein [Streptomyces triculaminicus]
MSGAADRELAVLLSTATRIEPELMRAVRLTAAPRLDVAAETELWFGDLVERRASGHIVLRRDLLPELRQELARQLATAREDAPVHRVGAIVDEAHRAGSPALHAEERAVWHAVRGGPRSERLIEEALLPALRALVDQHRDGVARWFAGAWGRLPEAVRKVKTAWQLATVTAALQGAAGTGVAIRRRPPDGLLLADVGLIAARLPRTELPVLRDGRHLILGQEAAVAGAYTLTLPDTDPLVLELTLSSGPPTTLLVGRGESATRRVDGHGVRLAVADGSVYEIPAPSAAPAGHAGTGDSTVPGPGRVLISYAGPERPWAVWLAHVLEQAGFRASPVHWEVDRRDALGGALEDLRAAGGRVLLVLSDWYVRLADRTDEEWMTACREVTERHPGRMTAVSVTHRPLPVGTALLEPVELWTVSEAEGSPARTGPARRPGRGPRRHRLPARPAPRFPNDPPLVWGAVPRRNVRFTGRDALLLDIQRLLTDAPPGAAVCALLGMSGIGKTQLAIEYAHRFSNDYDVVWWVDADTSGTLRERLAELAVELGLTAGSEPGGRVRAVREALRRGEPHRGWLIVFDGWDDLEEAGELLPQGPGHVLITSRNRGWHDAGATVVEVPAFLRHESVRYLTGRARRLQHDEADAVAIALGDLPLAVAQAAAWLSESGMGVDDYLRMVLEGEPSEPYGPDQVSHLSRSALTSWLILIDRLRDTQPHAAELLALCTCFGPGAIPLGLVRRVPPGELPEALAEAVTEPRHWTRALGTLVDYSVITREHHGPGDEAARPEDDVVYMHRIVHDIVARLTPPDLRRTYQRLVRRVLAAAGPGNPQDARLWPRYAELLPHLEPSGALSAAEPDVRRLVLNCLMFTYVSGIYRAGLELAERVRARWEELFPPDDPQMLDLTVRQGNILRAHGRFHAAYDLDRAMLERLRATPGTGRDVALMSATSCLAADQRFLGQYEEALQLQREVLETALALRGPDDYLTLLARHNLGAGLRLLGRYAQAYEIDVETLHRRESLLRTRHPATLGSSLACARDLRLMGRYRDALARQELGVRLHVQVLGPLHPQTLRARHNLLLCELRATGGPETDAGMSGLLEQMEQVHGRDHYVTLGLVVDLGNHAREQGDLDRARDLIAEGESGFRDMLGPAHPVSTGMLSNVALVLQAAGEHVDALALFEAALAGLTATLGPDHPWVLGCALNAAAGRNVTGRLDSAENLSRDTLRRARRALGADHPFTLSCEIALAADLRALREREQAAKVEEDALQRLTRTLGAQHPQTLAARRRTRPTWDFEPYLG